MIFTHLLHVIVQFCIVICGTMLASRKHVCKSQGMLIIIGYDKPGKICLTYFPRYDQ